MAAQSLFRISRHPEVFTAIYNSNKIIALMLTGKKIPQNYPQ